jgi:signal transduction histidine kinase/ActR/RegA family two-component response regulator
MSMFSFLKKSDSEVKKVTDFKNLLTKDVLQEALNVTDNIILLFTKADGWVGANGAFYKTFGFKNIEEFRKKYESIRELFSSESEEVFTEDDKSWLDYIKKHKQDGYTLSIYTPAQETLQLSAKCHTFHAPQEFYLLELQDVSKLFEAELKTQEVEKLKSKFLSNIGHEFRTPMNGILGFVELLDKTNLDAKQTEYLQMISRSSKNLMSNIEILLDLAQMQGGRLKVDTAPFSLLDDMEKLSYEFFLQGVEKGISVQSFIDPKLPKELESDATKIKQIMSSLIQNALKFTKRGGRVVVEVKLLKRQLNGDCSIGFGVKDNGKGIANEQIALITEPFTAGNQADERLGVGLSLSNGLIELLGGKLKIQSQENVGSYFNFVLNFKASRGQSYKMMPKKKVKVLLLDSSKIDDANFLTIYLRAFAVDVVKANVLDETIYDGIDALYIVANQADSSWMLKLGTFAKKSSVVILLDDQEKLQTKLTHIVDEVIKKPLLPSSFAKHLNKMYHVEELKKEEKLHLKERTTALVVEDNLINQRLIKILLQEYDIAVRTATNGNEAVKLCEQNSFDIIFMDIDMPEKNGIIATQEIKDTLTPNKKMPIVALTAMAMEGDKEMLLREGLDDYISKPLTREKLENILNKYLTSTTITK